MSRSIKRVPIVKDSPKGRKAFKNLANKKVRRCNEVPNGCGYKQVSESWDITDYKIFNPDAKNILRK